MNNFNIFLSFLIMTLSYAAISIGCQPINRSNLNNSSELKPEFTSKIITTNIETRPNIIEAVPKLTFDSNGIWSFCSGVHLENGRILTAAHCTWNIAEERRLYLDNIRFVLRKEYGLPGFYEGHFVPPVQGVYDWSYLSFPLGNKFNPFISYKQDLLLIKPGKERTPFTINQEKLPIFLLPEKDEPLPNDLFISGWGIFEIKANVEPPSESDYKERMELRTAAVFVDKQKVDSIPTSEVCDRIHEPGRRERCEMICEEQNELIKTGELFCFRSLNAEFGLDTPNHGDSGGPLYSMNQSGQPVLRGVFSTFSWNENHITQYFCYTNISKNLDWIKSHLN